MLLKEHKNLWRTALVFENVNSWKCTLIVKQKRIYKDISFGARNSKWHLLWKEVKPLTQMINIKIPFVIWRSLFIEKYHRIKYFKDNIHKIFWGC